MKRFSPELNSSGLYPYVEMEESAHGDYVLWDDVAKLLGDIEEWKRRATYVEGEVSAAFGLPPTIGPAPGEMKRVINRVEELELDLKAMRVSREDALSAGVDAEQRLAAELGAMNEVILSWVCAECGEAYGHRPCGKWATWHDGTCGVCQRERVPVTEPRDFGGLRPDSREREMKLSVDSIRAELSTQVVLVGQLRGELSAARKVAEQLGGVLDELLAVVRDECPSLLDEDSGGNARLEMEVESALAEWRAKQ